MLGMRLPVSLCVYAHDMGSFCLTAWVTYRKANGTLASLLDVKAHTESRAGGVGKGMKHHFP